MSTPATARQYPSSGQLSQHLIAEGSSWSAEGWSNNVLSLASCLVTLEVSGERGRTMAPDRGFTRWTRLAAKVRQREGVVYLVGNGASASMASHMAADLAKNGGLHTQVFSDLSLITALANDLSYEEVFAEPLRRRLRAEDLLVAISSSGASANVLRAVEVARERGSTVVTLSAMAPGNPLRKGGNLNFYVGASTYGGAESCHAAILHYWMDLVERDFLNATMPPAG